MGEGLKGASKANVDPVFKDRLTDLQDQADNAGQAFRRQAQRKWHLPKGWKDKDLLAPDKLHEPDFKRDSLNETYKSCLKEGGESAGTSGDSIALKQQIDYNFAEERALRLRHGSTVRCLTHAAARKAGQKDSQTFPNIEARVGDMIKAGGQ